MQEGIGFNLQRTSPELISFMTIYKIIFLRMAHRNLPHHFWSFLYKYAFSVSEQIIATPSSAKKSSHVTLLSTKMRFSIVCSLLNHCKPLCHVLIEEMAFNGGELWPKLWERLTNVQSLRMLKRGESRWLSSGSWHACCLALIIQTLELSFKIITFLWTVWFQRKFSYFLSLL